MQTVTAAYCPSPSLNCKAENMKHNNDDHSNGWVTLLQVTLKCQFIVKRSQPCVVFTLWVKGANIILHTLRIIFHVAADVWWGTDASSDSPSVLASHLYSHLVFLHPRCDTNMQSLTHTPWHLEPTAGAERIIKMFSSNVHKLWFYRSWDREKKVLPLCKCAQYKSTSGTNGRHHWAAAMFV